MDAESDRVSVLPGANRRHLYNYEDLMYAL